MTAEPVQALLLLMLSAVLVVCTPPTTGMVVDPVAETVELRASYTVVGTGQRFCTDDRTGIECPQVGQSYFGQDAQYAAARPSY